MIAKSIRSNNKTLTQREQEKLREITAPYGHLKAMADGLGIIPDTLRNIIQRGSGKSEYVQKIREQILSTNQTAA